jgi:alpha-amylase/alpha-mannosidase (GH57 family)
MVLEQGELTPMPKPLTIHGHFYQPPRENPWTDVIDDQPSAAPLANWNERVYAECYRPNAFARVLDPNGRVQRIVNNYEHLSFNFGPTLLSWMEKYHPFTYAKVLEADTRSAKRFGGHGNAIAQAYNHSILPLCNQRDRLTQIRWGVADFKHRFGREPESLWLSETAANDDVLDDLIDEKLRYVILSPFQAERVKPKDGAWIQVADGSIDPGRPYRYLHRDKSGRSIAVFFYDPSIAKSIAFEGALTSSEALMGLLQVSGGAADRLLHTATDGESYGHHAKFGDRSLAYALETLAPANGFQLTNYGEYLEKNPPTWEVEIKKGPNGEGTAWSCSHGVGRWIRNCGCHTGGHHGWTQNWRGPLREAFDYLRDKVAVIFEAERGKLFGDPWAARDAYIELILDRNADKDAFLKRQFKRDLDAKQKVQALTHLEIQRHSLLMYTSCAWFFNDLSGIETVQVLQYAGRVLDLLESLGIQSHREPFLAILAKAHSNIHEFGDGRQIFRKYVDTARVTAPQVVAHLAMALLATPEESLKGEVGGYRYVLDDLRREPHGRLVFATGRVALEDVNTGRRHQHCFASLHMGGLDFTCNVSEDPGADDFNHAASRLWEHFYTMSLARFLGLMADVFGSQEFGMEHLLPEGRRSLFAAVFGKLVNRFVTQYAALYEENRRNFEMLQQAGFHVPRELTASAEFTLSRRFNDLLSEVRGSRVASDYSQALAIVKEAARQGLNIDRIEGNKAFTLLLREAVQTAVNESTVVNVQAAIDLLDVAKKMGLEPDINRPQEMLFEAADSSSEFEPVIPLAERLGFHVPSLAEINVGRVVEALRIQKEGSSHDTSEDT